MLRNTSLMVYLNENTGHTDEDTCAEFIGHRPQILQVERSIVVQYVAAAFPPLISCIQQELPDLLSHLRPVGNKVLW